MTRLCLVKALKKICSKFFKKSLDNLSGLEYNTPILFLTKASGESGFACASFYFMRFPIKDDKGIPASKF